MKDLKDMLKQAQEMQQGMSDMHVALEGAMLEGSAGAGMVKVTMTGKHEVRRVAIDDSLLADDKDMLEDLVAAAINDASHKVEATTQERMSGLAGGLNLPPGMKLPF